MDAKSSAVAVVSEPLKYQTWFLKVSIHCEGCRRKVKKVLRSIDGVFTSTIDPQQQKVTVTGSVGVETLIRKLVKAGKHAEIWPEHISGKGSKTSGKPKQRNEQSVETHSGSNPESNLVPAKKNRGIQNQNANNSGNDESKKIRDPQTGKNSPVKSPAVVQAPESEVPATVNGGGEGSVKKKKKKVQSDGMGSSNGLSSGSASAPVPSSGAGAHTGSQVVGQINLSPTRQQAYLYPETYYNPPLLCFATYNNRFVGGPSSYYVSPLPYISSGIDHDPYHFQSPPSVPFEIFSDENANGCCVM